MYQDHMIENWQAAMGLTPRFPYSETSAPPPGPRFPCGSPGRRQADSLVQCPPQMSYQACTKAVRLTPKWVETVVSQVTTLCPHQASDLRLGGPQNRAPSDGDVNGDLASNGETPGEAEVFSESRDPRGQCQGNWQ